MTTVLVVDDSLTVRMDLVEALEGAGLAVESCATLAEARVALARNAFSLVVLDVVLPDGDGVSFLQEIRSSSSSSPATVMLLSTEAEVRDRIRGLAKGADEYIGKPYEPGYVVARAKELLAEKAKTTDVVATTPTILIIDDSPIFRDQLTRALEGASYRVLSAVTGEEGLRVAAHARPNAMIVDGMLPGIDGAGVIRRIRLDAALRRTPCLLFTASDDHGTEIRALDAGADAFVHKDEEMSVVLARLGAILRNAGSRTPETEPSSLLGTKKILAVDDSVTYREEIGSTLRAEGYEVVLARSGEEALELLAVQPVDCILLDLLMPGLGGEETCRRIKAAPNMRDIPIVMLTGLDDREAMIRGFAAGADEYITKSSDHQILKARVRAQMRRKHFEDENRRIREELLQKEIEAAEARAARELAETRAALVKELEWKNRELEAFSYSVSHDLRAPVRRIDGFTAMLLEDYGDQLEGKASDYLRRVRASAKRLGELIDDLLRLSRVGRAEIRREHVDLSAIAALVAAELERSNPDRKVEVKLEEPMPALGDPGLMRAVLENLLGNAWKFTAQTEHAVIEIGTERGDPDVVYFVRDNGVGFDAEHARKLFFPFQRLHSETEFAGTGIGLATVRRIIERHGGKVWAEGAVGKGATMRWTLPERKQ